MLRNSFWLMDFWTNIDLFSGVKQCANILKFNFRVPWCEMCLQMIFTVLDMRICDAEPSPKLANGLEDNVNNLSVNTNLNLNLIPKINLRVSIKCISQKCIHWNLIKNSGAAKVLPTLQTISLSQAQNSFHNL